MASTGCGTISQIELVVMMLAVMATACSQAAGPGADLTTEPGLDLDPF